MCGFGKTTAGQLLQVTTTVAQPAAPPAAPAAAAAMAGARARHSASSTAAAAPLVLRRLWLDRSETAADVPHSKFKISRRRFSTCVCQFRMQPTCRALQQQAQCWLSRQATIDIAHESEPVELVVPDDDQHDGRVHDGRKHQCRWQAALVLVDCCNVAPEMYSMKQSGSTFATSSSSSAATIDEAACARSQPANSHNRGRRHDRARPPTSHRAKFFFGVR